MGWRDDELADLRWHWGGAYDIIFPGRTFSALRRDGLACVTALTAGGLRRKIRADYPRHIVKPHIGQRRDHG